MSLGTAASIGAFFTRNFKTATSTVNTTRTLVPQHLGNARASYRLGTMGGPMTAGAKAKVAWGTSKTHAAKIWAGYSPAQKEFMSTAGAAAGIGYAAGQLT